MGFSSHRREEKYRGFRIILLLTAGLAGAAAAPAAVPGGAPVDVERVGSSSVHVVLETIAVDRRGTWSVGIDEADLIAGTPGVLEKSVTLIGRGDTDALREMVQLTVTVRPELTRDPGCGLHLDTEARGVLSAGRGPAGGQPADRRSTLLRLREGEDRFVEIYASGGTGGRLGIKLRCEPDPIAAPTGVSFFNLVLSAERAVDEGPMEMLKTNMLQVVLGREAGNQFAFHIALGDGPGGAKRYRREEFEVTMAPRLVAGGRARIDLSLRGSVSTVSATAPTVSHPVARSEAFLTAPGELQTLDFEVRSSGPEEGWSRVRYRLQLLSRF